MRLVAGGDLYEMRFGVRSRFFARSDDKVDIGVYDYREYFTNKSLLQERALYMYADVQ